MCRWGIGTTGGGGGVQSAGDSPPVAVAGTAWERRLGQGMRPRCGTRYGHSRYPCASLLKGLVVGMLALLASECALASELWTSDDGEVTLEAWGYVKTQNVGLHFRDIGLPLYETNSGGWSATRVRGALDLYWGDIRLNVEHEVSMRLATSGAETLQGTSGAGSTDVVRPRLYDFADLDGSGVTLGNSLDRFWVLIPVGVADVSIGRQAVSWGSAWFWKPTDRFSPFSPMDIDPDVKRGVDAVRVELLLGRSTGLDLVATFERHEGTDRELWAHGGARFRTTWGRYDLALSVARFQLTHASDYMVGGEFAGELGDVGFRGEAAFNYLPETEQWDVEGVVGADYRFSVGLTLAGELFYNGLGTDDSDQYAAFVWKPDSTASERLRRGEAFNIGRYYTGVAMTQEVTPLLSLTLSAVANWADPSALLLGGIQWSVVQNGRLTAGALLPLGAKPDWDNWSHPVSSEYGLAPLLGYLVLKVSF